MMFCYLQHLTNNILTSVRISMKIFYLRVSLLWSIPTYAKELSNSSTTKTKYIKIVRCTVWRYILLLYTSTPLHFRGNVYLTAIVTSYFACFVYFTLRYCYSYWSKLILLSWLTFGEGVTQWKETSGKFQNKSEVGWVTERETLQQVLPSMFTFPPFLLSNNFLRLIHLLVSRTNCAYRQLSHGHGVSFMPASSPPSFMLFFWAYPFI